MGSLIIFAFVKATFITPSPGEKKSENTANTIIQLMKFGKVAAVCKNLPYLLNRISDNRIAKIAAKGIMEKARKLIASVFTNTPDRSDPDKAVLKYFKPTKAQSLRRIPIL